MLLLSIGIPSTKWPLTLAKLPHDVCTCHLAQNEGTGNKSIQRNARCGERGKHSNPLKFHITFRVARWLSGWTNTKNMFIHLPKLKSNIQNHLVLQRDILIWQWIYQIQYMKLFQPIQFVALHLPYIPLQGDYLPAKMTMAISTNVFSIIVFV